MPVATESMLMMTPLQRKELEQAGIEPTVPGVIRHLYGITPPSKRLGILPLGDNGFACIGKGRLYNWAKKTGIFVDLNAAVHAGSVAVGGQKPYEWIACDVVTRDGGPCDCRAGREELRLPPRLPMPPRRGLSGPSGEPPPSPPPSPSPASPPAGSQQSSPRVVLATTLTEKHDKATTKPSPSPTPSAIHVAPAARSPATPARRTLDALLDPSTTAVGLVAAAEDLCCPITLEPFEQPVVAEDGFTYESAAIGEWIAHRGTSPSTGAPMGSAVVPNHVLRRLIHAQR